MFILNEEALYFLQSLSAGLLSRGALLLGAFPSCVSSSGFSGGTDTGLVWSLGVVPVTVGLRNCPTTMLG